MENFKKAFTILAGIILFLTSNLQAQLYAPSGTVLPASQVLIGTPTPISDTDPNTTYGLEIEGDTVTYGAKGALYGRSVANGTTAIGRGTGLLGYSSSWHATGSVRGIGGYAQDVTRLNVTVANKAASALGGYFHTNITDPIIDPTTGKYYIAGSMSVLDGSIATYPADGVVAAVYGLDRIKGIGTWGGYFDGRGYFGGPVGINNKNALSDLSINGDGDARHVVSVTTPTHRGNGTAGIVSQLPQITNASDWSRSIQGRIEAGAGNAVGVQGSAYTTTPSNAGRTYGVYAQAGNATSGYNYALFSELLGQNDGAAVLGWDRVNFPTWNKNTTGSWAGKFIGNSHFSNKVAIGTTSMPSMTTVNGEDYLLYVLGGGRFTEVIVTPAWADYVFEENYKLLDLETVENHIKEKGHLHNTPSGAEIEKHGMEVGQMMANQQEKIEELFLHLIDMNKTMKALKTENENLKAELTALKK